MATFGTNVRRGLPRVSGGDPWPPAGEAPVAESVAESSAVEASPSSVAEPVHSSAASTVDMTAGASLEQGLEEAVASAPESAAVTKPQAQASGARAIRRGLPRVPGGEPWPPAGAAPVAASSAAEPVEAAPAPMGAPPVEAPAATTADTTVGATSTPAPQEPLAPEPETAAPTTTAPESATGARALRRGLPRVAGGEPWPPAGIAPSAPVRAPEPLATPDAAAPAAAAVEALPEALPPASVPEATATGTPLTEPLPFPRTVWPGTAARTRPTPEAEPKRYGPFTRLQWAGAVIVAGGGLLYAAGMAVLVVRWLLSTEWGVGFLEAFPGEYHLPEGAPVGIPAWLGWQHFFNVFLMVLIIRSGLRVRTEKRPTVFWSPRNNGRRKISLTLWFHQALDILWLVNGAAYVVLLFATGQWVRIVPTSWEVFPNAFSAALQYASLDWPTENGWVNYNSLQQLAYFATVFIAAPLAAITGVRMSGVWPKNATALNKAYPVEWARAVHFPVMIYFVLFIFVHVVLVFATGALRNLNHMYAAQGSPDPDAYMGNWAGFWIFAVSMLVIAAAWVAARPLVLAPVARLFGKVSGR